MSRHFSPERGKIRKGKYEKAKEMVGVEGSRNSSFLARVLKFLGLLSS